MAGVIDFDALRARYADPRAFVQGLRERMWNHGISQGQLAERSGYGPWAISRWVGSRRVTPTIDTMLVLDETLEKLIQGD